jgi:hypothetical protein
MQDSGAGIFAAAANLGDPFVFGSLTDVAGIPTLADAFPAYPAVLDWLTAFVARPSPELKRPGPVCPHVAPALRRDVLRFVSLHSVIPTAEAALELAPHLAKLFLRLFEGTPDIRDAALLVLLPEMPAEHAAAFIDGGHRLARMEFVRRGLMLGEFHGRSAVGSIRNGDFKVMRAPVPMFVVRAMSTHDVKFLDAPQWPAGERIRALQLYRKHVSDLLTPVMRADVERRLAALQV